MNSFEQTLMEKVAKNRATKMVDSGKLSVESLDRLYGDAQKDRIIRMNRQRDPRKLYQKCL